MNEAGREKLREQVAQSVAAFNALPPLERAIETLRQKRSFVRGLMPMDSPLNDEQINEIINQAPEFVILDALTTALATIEAQGKEIERLKAGLEAVRDLAISDHKEWCSIQDNDRAQLTAANARIAELERLNTALTENNTQLSRWYEDREKFLVVNGLWDKFQADRESGALWKDVIDLLSEPKKKG